MKAVIRAVAIASLLCCSPAGAQEFALPKGYPADYAKLVEASRTEPELLIYSNISTINWEQFIALAKERFPWITITTTDDNTQFEKYFAESAAKVRTADMIVTASPERWPDFVARGQVLSYDSPEKPNLPDWSLEGGPSVYAASFDPFIFSYNRRAFDGVAAPKSVADVAAALGANAALKGRIGTYTPEVSLGLAIWQAWVEDKGDAGWDLIKSIGVSMRPEPSAGTMREKVATGEYAVAMFTSGAGIRQYEAPAVKALAGWGYPSDGTPLVQRSAAITSSAASPDSAKLVLDLLLSREGQIAFAKGGQTPYRADIASGDVPYSSYNAIVEAVGKENILFIVPKASMLKGQEEFMKRWNAALGR